jgi:hypothetical protein
MPADRLNPAQTAFVAASLATAQAREIFARFDEAGIVVAPLKGVWFVHWLYSDSEPRPLTDVDLLVAPAQVKQAGEILRTLGYRADDSPRARLGFGAWVERTYRRPGYLPVELHRAVATGRGAARLSARLLAEGRPGEAPFEFTCVRLPDSALALSALALHFRDHGLAMADYQAEDVRRLARRPDLELARALVLCEESGGLFALERLLALVAPDLHGGLEALRLHHRIKRGVLDLLTRRTETGFETRLPFGARPVMRRGWRLALHLCLARDSLKESAASQLDHAVYTLGALLELWNGQAND